MLETIMMYVYGGAAGAAILYVVQFIYNKFFAKKVDTLEPIVRTTLPISGVLEGKSAQDKHTEFLHDLIKDLLNKADKKV